MAFYEFCGIGSSNLYGIIPRCLRRGSSFQILEILNEKIQIMRGLSIFDNFRFAPKEINLHEKS